jgi:MFS family permease
VYLQEGDGASPGVAGALTAAIPLGICVAAPCAWRLSLRIGPRSATALAMAVTAFGVALLVAVPPRWWLVALLGTCGFGLGLFTPANNAAAAATGSPSQAGTVSGLINLARALGTAAGVAVAGAVLSGVAGAHPDTHAAASGLRAVAVALCAAAIVSALLSIGGGRADFRDTRVD